MRIMIPAVAALALVACGKPATAPADTATSTTATPAATAPAATGAPATMANATAAAATPATLAGKYRGTMPTADGAGAEATVNLKADGSYELSKVGADKKATKVTGKFTVNPDGKTVVLDAAGGGTQLMTAEGGVHVLDATGKPYAGTDAAKYVLRKQ